MSETDTIIRCLGTSEYFRITVGTRPRKKRDRTRGQRRKMWRGIPQGIRELSEGWTPERGFRQSGRRVPSRGDAKERIGVETARLLSASFAHKKRRESPRDGQMR